jgi:hypothetical protein
MKIIEEVEPVSMSVKALARALGVREGLIRYRVAREEIPSFLLGGRRLIPAWYLEQIREFMPQPEPKEAE